MLYGAPWLPTEVSAFFRGVPMLILYSLLCLLLTVQIWPRVATVALLLLHHSLFIQPTLLSYGFDYLCATALFFCAVIPTQPTSRIPLRAIQICLCIIYFSAGFAKLSGPTRWTGGALWKAATLPGFEGPLSSVIYALSEFTGLWIEAGWLVVAIEVLYPLLIWFRSTRSLWLWATLVMHAAIALSMVLYGFSVLMMLLNLVAFHLPHRQGQRFQHDPIHFNPYMIRLIGRRAKPSRHRTAD